MVVPELQRLVDGLGARLGRGAAIDDRRLRLVAASPDIGAVDSVRIESILRREAPEKARALVEQYGLAKSEGPLRVPAIPEIGMRARLCVPIRHQENLLGYLFLIDEDEPLRDDEIVLAEETALQAAPIIFRERLRTQLERSRERELLRDLLSEDEPLRREAATALVDEEILEPGNSFVALVVRLAAQLSPSYDASQVVDEVLWSVRQTTQRGEAVHMVRLESGVLVTAHNSEATALRQAHVLANLISNRIVEYLGEKPPPRPIVGIGSLEHELADVRRSFRRAEQTTHVAEVVGTMGDVSSWDNLGLYRVLGWYPTQQLMEDAVDPRIGWLQQARGGDTLLTTLEVYLDCAGDSRRASGKLVVHKTTLYYRLERIEQIAHVDLSNGEERLSLHLGVKMARIIGVFDREPPRGK